MEKRERNPARESRFPKKKKVEEIENFDDLNDEDDEIDALHKKRDKIPLDFDDDLGVSSDDDVFPVLNYKDIDDDDEDEDEEDDDEESEVNDMIRKIKRTQKFLETKTGGVEDEMHDDSEDNDEKKVGWGMGWSYHGADNVGAELNSSDADSLAEEEEEAKRLQREREKLSLADFCLDDASDMEPTFEVRCIFVILFFSGSQVLDALGKCILYNQELSKKGKNPSKPSGIAYTKDEIDAGCGEVKSDLSGLSRDELMEVMYSSAPELVGLLGELNDALQQLEQEVDPLLSKKTASLSHACPKDGDSNASSGGKQQRECKYVRAVLEEKLKQKGIITTSTQQEVGAKGHKSKLLNGRLETLDDFDDDAMDVDGAGHGLSNVKALRLSN
ncbi:THALLO-like protein [Drosera capensis]